MASLRTWTWHCCFENSIRSTLVTLGVCARVCPGVPCAHTSGRATCHAPRAAGPAGPRHGVWAPWGAHCTRLTCFTWRTGRYGCYGASCSRCSRRSGARCLRGWLRELARCARVAWEMHARAEGHALGAMFASAGAHTEESVCLRGSAVSRWRWKRVHTAAADARRRAGCDWEAL